MYQYDLLLNSSLLGEDTCAELIVLAARAKLAARGQWAGAAALGRRDRGVKQTPPASGGR